MWDGLNNDNGGSDAGTELYIIMQYHDYKMEKAWSSRLMKYNAW
jgi:hypothetical protein